MAPAASHLQAIVRELEALGGAITGDQALAILARNALTLRDVEGFVVPKPDGYSRQHVARTQAFELLVLTWLPGQGSGAHDHAGSVSAFKILQGTAEETRFAQAADTLVDPVGMSELRTGDVGIDPGDVIHAVRNGRNEVLVSVHVHAPPIRELRRFTQRSTTHPRR
jgi:predicted metal-dependent enzyme (double-stranded beta helix superfamily)